MRALPLFCLLWLIVNCFALHENMTPASKYQDVFAEDISFSYPVQDEKKETAAAVEEEYEFEPTSSTAFIENLKTTSCTRDDAEATGDFTENAVCTKIVDCDFVLNLFPEVYAVAINCTTVTKPICAVEEAYE